MATHSSVLAWRILGMGSLIGCRLWGRTESDTTEATQQQQQQQLFLNKPILAGEIAVCPFQVNSIKPTHSPRNGSSDCLQHLTIPNITLHPYTGPFRYTHTHTHMYIHRRKVTWTWSMNTLKLTQVPSGSFSRKMQNYIFINSVWSYRSPQLFLKLSNFTIIQI